MLKKSLIIAFSCLLSSAMAENVAGLAAIAELSLEESAQLEAQIASKKNKLTRHKIMVAVICSVIGTAATIAAIGGILYLLKRQAHPAPVDHLAELRAAALHNRYQGVARNLLPDLEYAHALRGAMVVIR